MYLFGGRGVHNTDYKNVNCWYVENDILAKKFHRGKSGDFVLENEYET